MTDTSSINFHKPFGTNGLESSCRLYDPLRNIFRLTKREYKEGKNRLSVTSEN